MLYWEEIKINKSANKVNSYIEKPIEWVSRMKS